LVRHWLSEPGKVNGSGAVSLERFLFGQDKHAMARLFGVGQQHAGCRFNPMRRFRRSFMTPRDFAALDQAIFLTPDSIAATTRPAADTSGMRPRSATC
jgi:hypothetical protein